MKVEKQGKHNKSVMHDESLMLKKRRKLAKKNRLKMKMMHRVEEDRDGWGSKDEKTSSRYLHLLSVRH
jgi:hypothetical protein